MTTPAPIHTAIVLDRSGSMSAIADDIVGGFNEYLAEQQQVEGEARLTMVQFDGQDPFELLYDGVPVGEAKPLTRDTYRPRGNTPLFDAVGTMLAYLSDDRRKRNALDLPEEDMIVMIITDGHENASREYHRGQIFEAIEARRTEGWAFLFLGANQDAYAEGRRMGVGPAQAANWETDPAETKRIWKEMSQSQTDHRRKSKEERLRNAEHYWKGKGA